MVGVATNSYQYCSVTVIEAYRIKDRLVFGGHIAVRLHQTKKLNIFKILTDSNRLSDKSKTFEFVEGSFILSHWQTWIRRNKSKRQLVDISIYNTACV
jgi:hypothetical protein